MQELDAWTQKAVIDPFHSVITECHPDQCEAISLGIKKAIREKVLESYRNGLKAKARPVRKDPRYAPEQTR